MDKLLKELYYNPKTGFKSLNKLYRTAKESNPEVSQKNIKEFLNKQYTYQVNKQEAKPKEYNTILAEKIRDFFQVDIMIYDRYEINKYKYILCCVDVHSRYVECRAMTNRETLPSSRIWIVSLKTWVSLNISSVIMSSTPEL